MGREDRHEPTQPGNPHQLTVDQHVHSRAAIERFGDPARGYRVRVLYTQTGRSRFRGPRSKVFVAERVWSQPAESLLFGKVETAFHEECERVRNPGTTVQHHDAVTAYVSIWMIRSELAEQPPDDSHLVLSSRNATSGSRPPRSKDEEEIIERKGAMFLRGDRVPSRFNATLLATMLHDRNMAVLRGIRWGVVRAAGPLGFICPDRPGFPLFLPVDRTTMLLATASDALATDEHVREFNRLSLTHAREYVFGHQDDIESTVAGVDWGPPGDRR